jgi:hypothetical protein
MKKLVAFAAAGMLAGASAYGSTTGAVSRNYDASYSALSSASAQGRNRMARLDALVHSGQLRKAGMKPKGLESNYDSKLGVATFLWAPPSVGGSHVKAASSLAYSPVKPALRAETAARGVLGQQASSLRIDRDSINSAKLASVHDIGRGPIIARFQQIKNGLEVYGRSLNVMMDRNYNAIATSGYFAPALIGRSKGLSAGTSSFSLGADSALARAFADMGGKVMPSFAAKGTAQGYTLYKPSRTFGDFHVAGAPRAKKVYYYSEGRYIPAWLTVVQAESADHADRTAYGHIISAVDGTVLVRKNLIANDSYTYRVFGDSSAPFHPQDEPIDNNTLDPFTAGPTGDEGRTQSPYNLATLLNSGMIGQIAATTAAASDPWLPAGATTTTGNNVVAFANLVGDDGFDSGDLRGAISSANTFDYPYTVDIDPTTTSQRQAAIVNQFYVDNWLHDFWYDHGFDEASGNAQTDNYGRGGIDGDPIQAQAQDDSGRNNANMETPPDGGSPIQRMFLWDGPLTGAAKVTITSPSGIGDLPFNTASFGPHAFSVSGDIVRPEAGNETACAAITTDLTGKIALIDRGTCNFDAKTLAAQNAGAIGVILADAASHCTDPTMPATCEAAPGLGAGDATTDAAITIGTVSVSYPDGQKMETASGTVTGSVTVQYAPDRDGTMDIQIVAHEFFHHVSNRLVGDAFGLSSTQGGGMGEGWSDFDAMLLTVRPDDAMVAGNDKYQGAYPLSSYVTFNQYFGIRRYPYSTQLTVNPLTFKHISYGVALPGDVPAAPGTDLTGTLATDADGNPIGNAEVHATGEVWCNVLWEIYASLLDDSRYTADTARSRMQDYIIEGLKMTPDAPTMLEARDALLAAARATDAGDFALMAKAFAKRGMGVGAIAPDRNDPQNLNAVESYTDLATELEVTDVAFSFDASNTTIGDADGDGVLDVGETGQLSFTIVNIGTQDMAASFDGQIAGASQDSTQTVAFGFANGGKVTVPALASGASTVVTVPVTLSSDSGIATPVALTLSFPDSADPSQPIPEGGTVATGAEYDAYVNYDLSKTATSDDISDVTANLGDWALSNGDGTFGPGWEIDDFTGFFTDQQTSGNAWYGPDNDHASDIRLTSPEVDVGSADFKMDFDHIFAFEFDETVDNTNIGYDGGVIEVSIDGGATWNDAFSSAVGGTVTTANGYNGVIYSLLADGTFDPSESASSLSDLHPGFIDTDAPDPDVTALEHVTVDFGTALAGKKVLVRFREVSDPFTGIFGWVVDNLAFTGASNKPFSSTVADAGDAQKLPVAVAAGPAKADTKKTVTLDGSGSSDPFNSALTYAWTQTAGDAVTLSDATAQQPTFTATKSGTYTFQLVVTDAFGKVSAPAATSVKVSSPSSDDGGAFSPMLLLPGLALAALRRRRRAMK